MHIPQWLVLTAVEALLALAVLLVLLLFYVRSLRTLLRRQQNHLREMAERTQTPEASPEPESEPPMVSISEHLARQLQWTGEAYTELAPDDDPQTPSPDAMQHPTLRAMALRHALLELETQGDDTPWNDMQWQALAERLEPLWATGGGDTDGELEAELASARKRIDNLEKFKKLFFEMESQWDSARTQAQDYHEQLAAMSSEVADQDKFDDLLERYYNVYNEIGDSLQSASDKPAGDNTRAEKDIVTVTRADPRTAEELDKLRNVAADQHRIIGKLQKRLQDAQSAEEKEQMIDDLQTQLDQQLRYVKESETCVQLLESELHTTVEKLNDYERQLDAGSEQGQENEQMRATLEQFTLESKDLIKRLEALEDENERLREGAGASQAPGNTDAGELGALKAEYNQLEAQYLELEEKYLALRMGQ